MLFKILFTYAVVLLITLDIARADNLKIMKGGISPDQKWAVVIETKSKAKVASDSNEPSAFLMDNQTKKIVGPLEEIDLQGDETTRRGRGEAEAFWSKDSQLLAINDDPDGFMFEFEVLYQIEHRRAKPQNVEIPMESALVKKQVSPRSHSSVNFSRWINETEFELDLDNYLPAGGTARYREVGSRWVVIKFIPEKAE